MITRTLLFIKHRLPWLWDGIEWLNALLYRLLHGRRMRHQIERAFDKFGLDGFEFRPLVRNDLNELQHLIDRQGKQRLRYFQPHRFDLKGLKQMHAKPSFLMFGVLSQGHLVGYFFLRCFWTRKCFVGRLIDQPFERRGIGRVMNQIMYHIAWWSGFRCYTTISKYNQAIIRSHKRNPYAHLIRGLSEDYMLVEFRPNVSENLANSGHPPDG